MKKNIILSILMLMLTFPLMAINQWVNVCDYGASGVKQSNATEAIQKAIDNCFLKGGGTVYLQAGDYTCGTIVMKSNVTLWLEAGATIWGSRVMEDFSYASHVSNFSGFENSSQTPILIYARDAKNIAIRGRGSIHAQAEREYLPLVSVDSFIVDETEKARLSGVEMKQYYKKDPATCMVYIVDCENVLIEDVELIESSGWTLHLQWTKKINIRGCRIYSSLVAGVNADGIDIDGCKDVCISDCIIKTGDDAIVLKTTLKEGRTETCENITVSNCVLTSTSTALKIGTETYADFSYVSFSNCVIRDTNRAMSIIVRDGAKVSYVSFSDIMLETNRKHFNWWGNGEPVWLVVKKRTPSSRIGRIDQVSFTNISGIGQGTSVIEGYSAEHPLGCIRLNQVDLRIEPESTPDKRATHAFRVCFVEKMSLSDVHFSWSGEDKEPNWGKLYHFEKINALKLHAVSGNDSGTRVESSEMNFQNVQHIIRH